MKIDDSLNFEDYSQYLISGFIKTFIAIERTHKCIFEQEDEVKAMAFLSQANSFVDTVKLLRLSTDDLTRIEFEKFINQFDIYHKEVSNNVFTNHSHQWSSIEYIKLIEDCYDLAVLLDIKYFIPKD